MIDSVTAIIITIINPPDRHLRLLNFLIIIISIMIISTIIIIPTIIIIIISIIIIIKIVSMIIIILLLLPLLTLFASSFAKMASSLRAIFHLSSAKSNCPPSPHLLVLRFPQKLLEHLEVPGEVGDLRPCADKHVERAVPLRQLRFVNALLLLLLPLPPL